MIVNVIFTIGRKRRKVSRTNVDDFQLDDKNEIVSDVYDDEQREEMLESDQITKKEASFMEGWKNLKIRKVQIIKTQLQ